MSINQLTFNGVLIYFVNLELLICATTDLQFPDIEMYLPVFIFS